MKELNIDNMKKIAGAGCNSGPKSCAPKKGCGSSKDCS